MKQVAGKITSVNFWVGVIAAVLLSVPVISGTALALTPAGTVIGNQATATYQDSVGNQFTAQSNLFSVTVSQVAGLSLTPSAQSRASAPGNQVQFPHTVKNTGNASDTFTLGTATGGVVTLTSVAVIRDDNGDGMVNPGEPTITSVVLAMDQSQMVVVRGIIPTTATNGQAGTITLTATSAFNAAVTSSSTDTADVVTKAVISISKSVSALSVNPNGTLDYTINYTNVGIASTSGIAVTLNGSPATRHVVRDALPANTTFNIFLGVPTPAGGEQVFHVSGVVDPDTYKTTLGVGETADAVAYLFTTALTGGQSGVFSFRVNVAASAQVQTISNTAVMKFNDSLAATSQSSNTTTTSVNFVAAVVIRDTDATIDDIQPVTSGGAGSTMVFTNQVENTANGADRFNITVANVSFPAGTTFALFAADGTSPLLDTNSDGIPDTGLMNASATLNVIMKATLPANATNAGAPFNATVTAKSVANSGISDPVTDRLLEIVFAKVDLTNTSALVAGAPLEPGEGPGPEGSAVLSVTGDPGATVNIDLHVNNTGPNPDTFELQFSNVGAGFAPGVLPSSITAIQFFMGDGSGNPTGAPITSTGQIGAAGNKEIIAKVTVSSSATGGAIISLFFRGISASSGAVDIIFDQLTVNTIRGITLQQNQTGQTSPGSATTYSHVLKNIGNVTEPSITLAAVNSQSALGFLTTIYLDNNGDGLINGADAVITSVDSLAAGASANLIIRVAAPSSSANGMIDTMTLTATPTGTVGGVAAPSAKSNTDVTTTVTGQIELTLAASPSGTQPPATVVTYTVTYLNVGAAAVSSLVVTDAIPVNTTYVGGSLRLGSTVLSDAADADAGTLISGTKGSVQFSIGTIASGATGTVSFQVTID
jgi:uncharacterized repeat protein (TIGR01451 family)